MPAHSAGQGEPVVKTTRWLPLFCFLSVAIAQQAPWGRADIPISSRDRVYAADQTSNTVSVIDPSSNKLLGVIRLGNPVPGALQPLYKGQLLVHGLGYAPDGKTLAVVSVGSNSVTLIETATNRVKGTIYVGRSPHEAFFTPDGRELWVTVRGEDYVSVIDPVQMKEARRIEVANGPGMTMFGPDGKYGFVCSSFTAEVAVIDRASHQIIKRLAQASPFCPNIAVSPENDEVWLTLKDVGRVQVFNAQPPFEQKSLLETGTITNHVNFVNNRNGKFAYVTIGGMNQVKVYRRSATPELIATIAVGELPHGLWQSGDGSRVYVAFENGGAAAAIDTLTNKVIANIPIGQTSQALVYVPNAVQNGAGTDNLMPPGEAANIVRLRLEAGNAALPNAHASAAVNSLGLLDLIELAPAGLAPKTQYEMYLAESDHAPFGKLVPLAAFTTNPDGGAIVQSMGPLKSLAAGGAVDTGVQSQRFLIVTELKDPSQVVLRQVAVSNAP
jgi:YVTN family beta-propeller protein